MVEGGVRRLLHDCIREPTGCASLHVLARGAVVQAESNLEIMATIG
jgi:hypothetical protein